MVYHFASSKKIAAGAYHFGFIILQGQFVKKKSPRALIIFLGNHFAGSLCWFCGGSDSSFSWVIIFLGNDCTCPGYDSCEICALNSKYFSRYGHFSIFANWIWRCFFLTLKKTFVIPWRARFKSPICGGNLRT